MNQQIQDRFIPRGAPRFAVGDWAYNPMGQHNARVLVADWDASLNGYTGGWRYCVPGLSTPDLCPARDNVPNVEYVETAPGSNCYRQVSA